MSTNATNRRIMSIAGHVSRAMLSRYSHVRMEAKRRALDEIAAQQRAADEKRNGAERQQAVVVSRVARYSSGVPLTRLPQALPTDDCSATFHGIYP
jgi:hypothetical protein